MLYTQGSPLLIAAGALLKDNKTGNILAQIKFRSISSKEIKAVKVSIRAFDVSGTEVQGVKDYQYLDLSVTRNMEFGQKTAVPLSDSVTRSFSVVCESVVFSDNSVWTAERNAAWESLPKQQNLENILVDLYQQYQRDTSVHSCLEPLEYKDLWICSCGAVNKQEESQCCSCAVSRNKIFSALDTEVLSQNQELFKAEEAEREMIREKECKQQQVKKRKITIVFSAVAAVVILFVVLVTQVFIPMQKYDSAVSLMESGNYEEAIAAFRQLGGYKDSFNMADECSKIISQYESAVDAMGNSVLTAYNLLEQLPDTYKDVSELKERCEVYTPYCGNFKWTKDAEDAFQSDFYFDEDGTVYWVCTGYNPLKITVGDAEEYTFFPEPTEVSEMTVEDEFHEIMYITISFKDGNLSCETSYYTSVTRDMEGNVISKEGYEKEPPVTAIPVD